MSFNQDPISKRGFADYDVGLRQYMISVFGHMSLGLLLTAVVAYLTSLSPDLMHYLFQTPLYYLVLFAPLGIVFYFSSRINSLRYETAQSLFYIYAFLIGLMTSSIFIVFSLGSIAQVFLTTAAMFGTMSLYGYVTQRDLTQFGSFLMMGLFGLIISMLLNSFIFKSTGMTFALSVVGVLLFTGLTAYDVQFIKAIYHDMDHDEMRNKKAIFGALKLYLDFINLFYMLLNIMGQQRRS